MRRDYIHDRPNVVCTLFNQIEANTLKGSVNFTPVGKNLKLDNGGKRKKNLIIKKRVHNGAGCFQEPKKDRKAPKICNTFAIFGSR